MLQAYNSQAYNPDFGVRDIPGLPHQRLEIDERTFRLIRDIPCGFTQRLQLPQPQANRIQAGEEDEFSKSSKIIPRLLTSLDKEWRVIGG
jgi:hypothetical protein